MTRRSANALLLLAGAVWGLGFVAQSSAMDAMPPVFFVGVRFLIAAAVLAPFAWVEARRAGAGVAPNDWRAFGLVGLALFAGITLQQIGLTVTTVTNAGFLTGLYVVLTPFVGFLLFADRPHPIVWPASLLALAGLFLLGGGRLDGLNWGDGLILACAVAWALQIVFVGKYVRRSGRPYALSFTQFAICGALGLGAAWVFEPLSWSAIWNAAPELLYTGILSSALTFTLQIIAQRHTTTPQAAIMLSSEALFAAAFAALLLGERVAAIGLAGCALLLAAMLTVEIGPTLVRRLTRRPAPQAPGDDAQEAP